MLLLLLDDNKRLDEGHAMTYNQTAQHSTACGKVDNRTFLLAPKRSGPLGAFFGIYIYLSIEMRKTYDTRKET